MQSIIATICFGFVSLQKVEEQARQNLPDDDEEEDGHET